MYKLTLDLPNLAQGGTVELDGLGVFTNGKTYEISAEEAEAFSNNHPASSPVYDSDHNIIGSTLMPGPTVMEAFGKMRGITIEIVAAEDESALDVAKAVAGKKGSKA